MSDNSALLRGISEGGVAKSGVEKIAIVAADTDGAKEAMAALSLKYGNVPFEEAEVIVALGGDGLMLETLHQVMGLHTPVYGMNFGSVGFLMNNFDPEGLLDRLDPAQATRIYPLAMEVVDQDGQTHHALAINEVSLFRASYQAAKIEIIVDGETRLDELICDGVLISTPAGSTAYNLSAHGPILPIDSTLLALTPISPFRPRRWRGAILPNRAVVTFKVREEAKRPVNAVADSAEFVNVASVTVREDRSSYAQLLFDAGHSLEERVLNEQFRF